MENKDKKAAEKSTGSKFAEYKGEFKRIMWPSKEELLKSTVTVIITCAIFGVLIFIMDFIFNGGMTMFSRIVS